MSETVKDGFKAIYGVTADEWADDYIHGLPGEAMDALCRNAEIQRRVLEKMAVFRDIENGVVDEWRIPGVHDMDDGRYALVGPLPEKEDEDG